MSPNNAERKDKGYSSAWLHHKGRNKHHMEYWIDYGVPDEGGDKGLCGMKMPLRYVVEMYIDRVAASLSGASRKSIHLSAKNCWQGRSPMSRRFWIN